MVAKSLWTNRGDQGDRLPDNAFQDIARTWSMEADTSSDDLVRQAFHAGLASFSGYSRIVNIVADDDVRMFCEEAAKLRHAHCKLLASLVHSPQTLMNGWDEESLVIRGRWNLVCNAIRRRGVCGSNELPMTIDAAEAHYEDLLLKAVEACADDVSGSLLEARFSVQQARSKWKSFCNAGF